MIKGLSPLSTLKDIKVNSQITAGCCVACLSPNAVNGLCEPCRNDLPANLWRCPTCALPLAFPASNRLCGDCLRSPPAFSHSVIPWRYQFPVDAMIRRYKYNGQRKYVRPLIAGLNQSLDQHFQNPEILLPEALIPAPMHHWRRFRRGFNQAQDIAEQLGREWGIPVQGRLVRRCRKVHSQRGLGRAERLRNLNGVFEVTGQVPERIAIVDDVVTTGATVRTLAQLLQASGARDIQVWALARTPG